MFLEYDLLKAEFSLDPEGDSQLSEFVISSLKLAYDIDIMQPLSPYEKTVKRLVNLSKGNWQRNTLAASLS